MRISDWSSYVCSSDLTLAGEWLQDLREGEALPGIMAEARPDILLHLAAQALVPESYRDPRGTWSSNLIATINLLQALRRSEERRGGKECVSTCRYRGSQYH